MWSNSGWSETDRDRIERLQVLRLGELLAEPGVILHLNLEFRLNLVCTTPAQVDRLLANTEALQHKVWLVFGSHLPLTVWFAQEKIWSSDSPEDQTALTLLPDDLELMQFNPSEEGSMATGTIAPRYDAERSNKSIDRLAEDAAKSTLPGVVSEIVATEVKEVLETNVKQQVAAYLTSTEFMDMVRGEVRSQLQPFTANSTSTSTNGTAAATMEPSAPAPAAAKRQPPAAKKKPAAKKTAPRRTAKAAKTEG